MLFETEEERTQAKIDMEIAKKLQEEFDEEDKK